jgi:ABC-type xylose transport system substrate-binding protein
MYIEYGKMAGMKNTFNETEMKKVTMNLPADLVEQVKQESEQTLTEIVREALQREIRMAAYKRLIELRGKVEFGMSWQEMKALRD